MPGLSCREKEPRPIALGQQPASSGQLLWRTPLFVSLPEATPARLPLPLRKLFVEGRSVIKVWRVISAMLSQLAGHIDLRADMQTSGNVAP